MSGGTGRAADSSGFRQLKLRRPPAARRINEVKFYDPARDPARPHRVRRRSTPLEEALETAATHSFHYLDFNADRGPNRLDNWNDDRVKSVIAAASRHHITLTLHTASSVNVAEFSPAWTRRLTVTWRATSTWPAAGAHGVVVHGGYHFSSVVAERMTASLER